MRFDGQRFGMAECRERVEGNINWACLKRRVRGAKVERVVTYGTGAGGTLDNRIQFGLRKRGGRWQINRVTYPRE